MKRYKSFYIYKCEMTAVSLSSFSCAFETMFVCLPPVILMLLFTDDSTSNRTRIALFFFLLPSWESCPFSVVFFFNHGLTHLLASYLVFSADAVCEWCPLPRFFKRKMFVFIKISILMALH